MNWVIFWLYVGVKCVFFSFQLVLVFVCGYLSVMELNIVLVCYCLVDMSKCWEWIFLKRWKNWMCLIRLLISFCGEGW